MFEDDRKKFWLAFMAEDRRRKINLKRLAKSVGRAPSTLYKFKDKGAGGPDLLEAISLELFGRNWIDVVAEQGGGKDEATDSGGGVVRGDSDYVRNLEKRLDALQMLVEQHLKGHSDGPAGEAKKT
jgi:hypothetical protein